MAIYYVKAGGTATGDAGREATTPRTGSFATMGVAAYYNSLRDMHNPQIPDTAAVAGDSVYVSDAHFYNHVGGNNYNLKQNINFIAVQDLNADKYTNILDGTGAKETTTASGKLTFSTGASFTINTYGISYDVSQELEFFSGDANMHVHIRDCELRYNSILQFSGSSSNPSHVYFKNAIIGSNTGNPVHQIQLTDCISLFVDCKFDNLFSIFSLTTGCDLTVINGDFATCDVSGNLGSFSNSIKAGKFIMHNCLLPSLDWIPDATLEHGLSFQFYGCHTSDGYYFNNTIDLLGTTNTEESTILNATYDGTNKISQKIITTATANIFMPYINQLVVIPAQDLTSNKTYEVEFTSDAVLTDADIWMEISRPDATNLALSISDYNMVIDILSSGTEHTTSSAAWTNALTNKYKMSVTISGMAGVSDALVNISIHVAKPSTTIIVDPQVTVT